MANVDGFLVGGASLKPAFLDIVKSASYKKWLNQTNCINIIIMKIINFKLEFIL